MDIKEKYPDGDAKNKLMKMAEERIKKVNLNFGDVPRLLVIETSEAAEIMKNLRSDDKKTRDALLSRAQKSILAYISNPSTFYNEWISQEGSSIQNEE